MVRDALGERLLATFLGEFEEQLRVMNADLLALEVQPLDPERLKSLFRVAHTLKGAARAADVPLVESACHALESLLAAARDGKLALAPGHFERLYAAADALEEARTRLVARHSLAGSPLEAVVATLGGQATVAPLHEAARPAPARVPEGRRTDGQVRVSADQLDRVLGSAGQLFVAVARASGRAPALQAVSEAAASIAADWRRSARPLRLALERAGAPRSAAALEKIGQRLQGLARETGRAATDAQRDARTMRRVSDEVLDRVRQLRMRPFADACEALPRAARDLAAAERKEVQLEILGGEVEADRAVLDGLREALLHLVRNAVDHGIEPPDERVRLGKPRCGRVTVAAALQGGRICVTVTDDGVGLNVPAIRANLERRGIPVPAEERELARAIFQGGLTTSAEPSPISGRGVGLDIVRAAVGGIRGSIEVTWEAGRGTTFAIECPPTLASIRALLVEVGSQTLAVPTGYVERVLRVEQGQIRRAEGRDVLPADPPIPLVALARLVPPLPERPLAARALAVLLAARGGRLAVVVDGVLAEQEIMVQPLAPAAGRPPLLSGAALLATGRVALVLDAPAVVGAGLAPDAGGVTRAAAAAAEPARRSVLVVDDSITTRTLEQSILEAAGYDVLAAGDGAEAWRALQEQGADAVVADVEMPRMDGFALCEAIRAANRFKSLPVVLVTAMETPQHRARGLEVGADAYIGKSSFDQQRLLDTLRDLLAEAPA
jgi:two-component system chemotaxis sensor kinase CheA